MISTVRAEAIVLKFNGGPVGLDTLAASISEESDTIMDVVEPYLLQLASSIARLCGRVATAQPTTTSTSPSLSAPTSSVSSRLPERHRVSRTQRTATIMIRLFYSILDTVSSARASRREDCLDVGGIDGRALQANCGPPAEACLTVARPAPMPARRAPARHYTPQPVEIGHIVGQPLHHLRALVDQRYMRDEELHAGRALCASEAQRIQFLAAVAAVGHENCPSGRSQEPPQRMPRAGMCTTVAPCWA